MFRRLENTQRGSNDFVREVQDNKGFCDLSSGASFSNKLRSLKNYIRRDDILKNTVVYFLIHILFLFSTIIYF